MPINVADYICLRQVKCIEKSHPDLEVGKLYVWFVGSDTDLDEIRVFNPYEDVRVYKKKSFRPVDPALSYLYQNTQ